MMSKKYEEVEMNETKKQEKRIGIAIATVVFFRLKHHKLNKLTELSEEAEVSRVERCLEWHYKKLDNNIHWHDFVTDFIMQNMKELVSGTNFNGMYLDDVEEVDNVYCKEEEYV
jgi:hypothetical protein